MDRLMEFAPAEGTVGRLYLALVEEREKVAQLTAENELLRQAIAATAPDMPDTEPTPITREA